VLGVLAGRGADKEQLLAAIGPDRLAIVKVMMTTLSSHRISSHLI
jgi:hypothetical protein